MVTFTELHPFKPGFDDLDPLSRSQGNHFSIASCFPTVERGPTERLVLMCRCVFAPSYGGKDYGILSVVSWSEGWDDEARGGEVGVGDQVFQLSTAKAVLEGDNTSPSPQHLAVAACRSCGDVTERTLLICNLPQIDGRCNQKLYIAGRLPLVSPNTSCLPQV